MKIAHLTVVIQCPHYAKESMASSNLHHQHSWRREMMSLSQSHSGYFFPIHLSLAHFWRVLPVPLCRNYLAVPSWDTIIQTLIPCNFHTCVSALTCLVFTIIYIGATSSTLRIRDTGAHWGLKWGGIYPLQRPDALQFDIFISYMTSFSNICVEIKWK